MKLFRVLKNFIRDIKLYTVYCSGFPFVFIHQIYTWLYKILSSLQVMIPYAKTKINFLPLIGTNADYHMNYGLNLVAVEPICQYFLLVGFKYRACPVGWGCRIHRLHLCRGVGSTPNECPRYETLQSKVTFQ